MVGRCEIFVLIVVERRPRQLVIRQVRLELEDESVVFAKELVGVLDVNIRDVPALGENVDMRERRRRLGDDHAADRRQASGKLLQHEYLVVADLDRVVQFVDDMDPADGCTCI